MRLCMQRSRRKVVKGAMTMFGLCAPFCFQNRLGKSLASGCVLPCVVYDTLHLRNALYSRPAQPSKYPRSLHAVEGFNRSDSCLIPVAPDTDTPVLISTLGSNLRCLAQCSMLNVEVCHNVTPQTDQIGQYHLDHLDYLVPRLPL